MLIFWFILAMAARCSVGAMLFITGKAKIQAGGTVFLRSVLAYELLPAWAARILASTLPPLEVVIGVLLLFGLLTQIAAITGIVLLMIVTVAVTIALVQGKSISCGCSGRQQKEQSIRWTILLRNICLIVALGITYFTGEYILSLDAMLASTGEWVHWIVALTLITLTSGLIVTWRMKVSRDTSYTHSTDPAPEASGIA